MMLNHWFGIFSLVVVCGLVGSTPAFAEKDAAKGWAAMRVVENPGAAENVRSDALNEVAYHLSLAEVQTHFLVLIIDRATPLKLKRALCVISRLGPKDAATAIDLEKYLHDLLEDPESNPLELKLIATSLENAVRSASADLNQFEFLVALFRDLEMSAMRAAKIPKEDGAEADPRREMRETIQELLKAISTYEDRRGLVYQGAPLVAGHAEHGKQMQTFGSLYTGHQSPESGYAAAVVLSTLVPDGHAKKTVVDGWLKELRPSYVSEAAAKESPPPAPTSVPATQSIPTPGTAEIIPTPAFAPPPPKPAPPVVKGGFAPAPAPAPKATPAATPPAPEPTSRKAPTPAPASAPNPPDPMLEPKPEPVPEPAPLSVDPVQQSLASIREASSDEAAISTIDELSAQLFENEPLQFAFIELMIDETLSPEIRRHVADRLGAAEEISESALDIIDGIYRQGTDEEAAESLNFTLAEQVLIVLGELTTPPTTTEEKPTDEDVFTEKAKRSDEEKPVDDKSGRPAEISPELPADLKSETPPAVEPITMPKPAPTVMVPAGRPPVPSSRERRKERKVRNPSKPAMTRIDPKTTTPLEAEKEASQTPKPKNLRKALIQDFTSPANSFGLRLACGIQLFRMTDKERLGTDEFFKVASVFQGVDLKRSNNASGISLEEIEFRRIAAQILLQSRRTLSRFDPKGGEAAQLTSLIREWSQARDVEFRAGFAAIAPHLPGNFAMVKKLGKGFVGFLHIVQAVLSPRFVRWPDAGSTPTSSRISMGNVRVA